MKCNSVITKIMLIVAGLGTLVIAVLSSLFPSIFFYTMKPYLLNQVSGLVTQTALRQSYIWSNNSFVHQLQSSSVVSGIIESYYAHPTIRASLKEQLIPYLPILENGVLYREQSTLDENMGYISFRHYFLLFTEEGDFFYDDRAKNIAQTFMRSDWYRGFSRKEHIFRHLPVMKALDETGEDIFCVVKSFQVGKRMCYSASIVPFQDIQRQFSDLTENGYSDYLIYSGGEVIYSNWMEESEIQVDSFPANMFEGRQYEPVKWEERDQIYYMALCTYSREDYRVAVRISREMLLLPYQEVFADFRLLIGVIALVLVGMFFVALKSILHRLSKLEKQMNRVQEGDYHVSLDTKSGDEIGRLSQAFHIMLEKIQEDKQKEERIQYTLMVSAIDPHYMYNTLNTVTALASMGRNEDVVTVNTALIATLKDRMKMKHFKIFDTIRNERDALRQYITIQDFLCSQKIDYQFIVLPEDLDIEIPKNILQPLVENSIKHGILCNEDKDGNQIQGRIIIRAEKKKTDIHLYIEDNGIGIDQSEIEAYFNAAASTNTKHTQNMQHLGISNILMRLQYLYGGLYRCEVSSEPGKGTRILLILPVDKE